MGVWIFMILAGNAPVSHQVHPAVLHVCICFAPTSPGSSSRPKRLCETLASITSPAWLRPEAKHFSLQKSTQIFTNSKLSSESVSLSSLKSCIISPHEHQDMTIPPSPHHHLVSCWAPPVGEKVAQQTPGRSLG